MQKTIYQRLNAVLWTLIVTFVVVLAIYVSVGRMLTSNLGAYQGDILQELNARVPFVIEAERVSGEWQSFTPIIVLASLKLSVPEGDMRPLTLSEGRIAIDVLDSLRSGSLQMTRIELENLALRGKLTDEGQFRLEGFDGGGVELRQWLRDFLLNVELVSLKQNTLNLGLPNGERRQLDLSLRLEREGSYRRLEVALHSNRGADISIIGEGVGNPFTTELFAGELYARVTTDDLGAVRQVLMNRLPGTWAEGAVDLELWLAIEKGETELQGRLNASNLLFTNEERGWQIPLQALSVEAQLVQGQDHWTLFGSDLELMQGGVGVKVPRLQFDGWGRALRIRAADVPVEPIADLVMDIYPTQGKLVDVLKTLDPEGTLTSLQVSLGDIESPANDWEIESRFRDLQVTSWRGAPGIRSATGYVEVSPGRGSLLLDSPNLTLEFPIIYSEPLNYSDFHGSLHIDWDAELVRLSSDLIVAQGAEGTAKALFGLDIPLQPGGIGADMSLLVGLENAHPMHRVKYVPDTLSETLRVWLSESIGDGVVEQGAFLWRGALRKSLPQHRTVQLAFNIRDTHVDYDPRWPAVDVAKGVILVDDSEVSVWADQARLYDSTIERLSIETWRVASNDLMLAVNGRMVGPAADGLAVLNQSPIDDVVKGAFRQWGMQGGLEVDLNFHLNLNDRAEPPLVDVQTRWREVDLDIRPGDVSLRAISGDFSYHSLRGFNTPGLDGTLWDKPFKAQVLHPGLGSDGVFDASSTITEITATTRADLADVRRWSKFEPLAFAAGETLVDVSLRVVPGGAPQLKVKSQLKGVSLDLPAPWRKAQNERSSLRLEMALGQQGGPMAIDLGEDLSMRLDIGNGRFNGGSLAVGQDPADLEPNVLLVTGYAPLVQGDEWRQFVSRYFLTEGESVSAQEGPAGDIGVDGETPPGLVVQVRELQADRLTIWGQSATDVVFSLGVDAGRWHLAVATDWLEADYRSAPGEEAASLLLKRLDLLGVAQLELEAAESGTSPLEVPRVEVVVDALHRGERKLGKLSFLLESEGPTVTASSITGELAGLEMGSSQPGQLSWQQGDPGLTSLRLDVGFDDLGETLERLGYERILETGSGDFNLDLKWPGPPQAFSLREGEGKILVAIKEGRFLEAPSGASGALKVVNILNLADIVQRLSLSHMFESGIPFDSVDGEVFLHSGTIEVAGMDVKGPSSFFFSGVADVEQRRLDGELVATLPVADNLPWVAALTAGLPVAAGVYVVSKLLQKQVNQLSSAVYSISGSWDDPQVEFAHIFDSGDGRDDDKQAGPESPSAQSAQSVP